MSAGPVTASRPAGEPPYSGWRGIARYRALLANAGSLFGTTVFSSLLGFGFWWLAAKLFPPEAVGYGSAAISAMVLIGTIGTLGLETALIGELAKRTGRAGPLVAAGLAVAAAGSAALAIGFALLAPALFPDLPPLPAGPGVLALFVLGAALTGLAFVLDAAFVGLLSGGLQLWRNISFSVGKLALLGAIAVVALDRPGTAILAAWVAGIAVSVLSVAVLLRGRGVRLWHPPDWVLLRRLPRVAAPHNWLNLVLDAPQFVVPILATALVSATAGAGFYAAWTILAFAYIVPFHLGTVLYAVGAGAARAPGREIRFTLRLSVLGGLIGVPAIMVLAPHVLGLFGASYAEQATTPLRLLALGYFPMVALAHFIAVCRIRDQVSRAAAVVTAASGLEIAAAAAGAVLNGLVGLSVGLLIAKCLVATVTVPTVLRAVASGQPADSDPDQPAAPPAAGPDQEEVRGHRVAEVR